MVAATGLSGVMAILLLCLYIWRNQAVKNASVSSADDDKDALVDEDERTDFDIPDFRYVY